MDKAAEEGMIALMGVNNGKNGGWVTPYGGRERVFSTNPIAAAVPASKHPAFMMDFATTVVAAGKLELSPDKDMKIPEGWAIDAQGRPATTSRAYIEGGAMLPFGAHKGYALLLLVELLAGALTGAGVAQEPTGSPSEGAGGNATFIIVLDIPHFTDVEQFYADVDGLFDRLKRVKPAAGFKEVIIPGEPEAAARVKKAGEGITVPGPIWEQIKAIATEGKVSLDDIEGESK
ncbi:MAG: Ldh family oxidoreductase [Anaerolineae bacterium]|nr:Ldh family oxidoreductase [Anaerolineae bacterium]